MLYIDYGTVLEVDLDDIRYLAPQFEKLNAQAIMARLSGIRPRAGDEWCGDSKRFLWHEAKVAYSKGDLLAQVDGYVTTTGGSLVSLNISTDRSGRNNFNYQMVARGFAEYDPPAILSDNFELNACRKIEYKSTVQDSHATTKVDRPEFRQIQQIQKILERRQVSLMSKADKGGPSSQDKYCSRQSYNYGW